MKRRESHWWMAHGDETGRRLREIHLIVLGRLPSRWLLVVVMVRVDGGRLDHRLGDLLLKTLQMSQNVRIGQQTVQS